MILGLKRLARHAWPLCGVIPMVVVADPPVGTASAQVDAMWHDYDVRFHFSSFHTYYSCSSFDYKLEQILIKLGARPGVKVMTTGCMGANDVGNMLNSRIKVSLPVAVQSQAESIAADYRSITLKTNEWGEMSSGDCELLEEVGKQLLPALKLTVTDNGVRCIPGQAVINNQTMTVKALVARPGKPQATKSTE